MAVNRITPAGQLLAPKDTLGAILVRGLHANKVVDKINELITAYSISSVVKSVGKIKIAEHNYRDSFGGSDIHFEDLRLVINNINGLIARDGISVVPLNEQLILDNSYRTPDDSFIIKELQYNTLVEGINSVIDNTNGPYVANPVPDQNYTTLFGTTNIDISNVFADPDGTTPTWSVHSNSDPGVVTVVKSGDLLAVTEVANGTTTIVLRATDGVFYVDDTFTITIAP